MLDSLVGFLGGLGHWGYLVIFLVVALECQAFLGLIMPGESLVLMPFVAGARSMRYPRFLLFNAAGCIAWATVFVLLGYGVGAHHLSDVLGAAAAGVAWLALSLTAVDTLRRSSGGGGRGTSPANRRRRKEATP